MISSRSGSNHVNACYEDVGMKEKLVVVDHATRRCSDKLESDLLMVRNGDEMDGQATMTIAIKEAHMRSGICEQIVSIPRNLLVQISQAMFHIRLSIAT